MVARCLEINHIDADPESADNLAARQLLDHSSSNRGKLDHQSVSIARNGQNVFFRAALPNCNGRTERREDTLFDSCVGHRGVGDYDLKFLHLFLFDGIDLLRRRRPGYPLNHDGLDASSAAY